MVEVRKASPADIARLAATLASAFDDDPVFTWLTPPANRLRRLNGFFTHQLQFAMRRDSVFTTTDDDGVAIWLPPDQWKVPTGDLLRLMPALARAFGVRLPRVLGGLATIEKHHPKDPPHWYLEFLGTRHEVQRKGIGTSVISHMLEVCDRDGIPAYLEASSPRNVPFYHRHGFEVREEVKLKNGPSVWAMWREPR